MAYITFRSGVTVTKRSCQAESGIDNCLWQTLIKVYRWSIRNGRQAGRGMSPTGANSHTGEEVGTTLYPYNGVQHPYPKLTKTAHVYGWVHGEVNNMAGWDFSFELSAESDNFYLDRELPDSTPWMFPMGVHFARGTGINSLDHRTPSSLGSFQTKLHLQLVQGR